MTKLTILAGLFVLLLAITMAIAEEQKDIEIVGVSNNRIKCSIINAEEDCQLYENIINVTLVTEKNISESDLSLQNNEGAMRAIPYGCRLIHKDLYECYFEIEPVINAARLAQDYEMVISLYPRGGGEVFTEYLGELKIEPEGISNAFDTGIKKSINKFNFDYIQLFVKDAIFNSGICTTVNIKNITFEDIVEYEKEFNKMGGRITNEKNDITLNRAITLLAAFSLM